MMPSNKPPIAGSIPASTGTSPAPAPLPIPPPPNQSLPEIFSLANFQFASARADPRYPQQPVIGSLYFANSDGHRRIRLNHKNGPQIGRFKLNGEWFFYPPGVQPPARGATTEAIDTWLQGPPIIFNVPVLNRRIIEYNAGHVNSSGRHKSRGLVAFPQTVTQNDINVIYNTILGFQGTNPDENNEILRDAINNHLSVVLWQPPFN
jgi:hypothetical protein